MTCGIFYKKEGEKNFIYQRIVSLRLFILKEEM